MIKNEMYCEFCGRVFYDKYWDGGYIDHYMNFSSPDHHKWTGKDVDTAFREIVKKGNDYRSIDDIKNRLNCFMQWPDVSEEVKDGTRCKCEFLIHKMGEAKLKAQKIVSEMTMLERRFLVDESKKNCQRPYGNEDGKLFDGFEEFEKDYKNNKTPYNPMKNIYNILNSFNSM